MLAINDDPVTIKGIEWGIIERGVQEGWVRPKTPIARSWSVGVVGSGPAGLAAAEELNALGPQRRRLRARRGPGRADPARRAGLQAREVDHRPAGGAAEQAGIVFLYGVEVGGELAVDELRARHDAVVLATGSRIERGIDLPGNDLPGIHTAMSYLVSATGTSPGGRPTITAAGKHVVVIGGGDTAADCVASAHREGAQSVTQLDIYPPPAGKKFRQLAQWPDFPKRLWSTYALDEGGKRYSSFNATAFTGNGHVAALTATTWGSRRFRADGETLELPADLVLIAIGFTGPERAAAGGARRQDRPRDRHDRLRHERRRRVRGRRRAPRAVVDRHRDRRRPRVLPRGPALPELQQLTVLRGVRERLELLDVLGVGLVERLALDVLARTSGR